MCKIGTFQGNLSIIFLRILNIYLFLKIFQKVEFLMLRWNILQYLTKMLRQYLNCNEILEIFLTSFCNILCYVGCNLLVFYFSLILWKKEKCKKNLIKFGCFVADVFQLTSESVVQAYIDRINEVQPILNCIAETRFTLALEEAKKCDALLASPNAPSAQVLAEQKPFLGIPFTTKVRVQIQAISLMIFFFNCIQFVHVEWMNK